METLDIMVESRSGKGKGAARALRRQGSVPGIVYGPRMASEPISLTAREFDKKVGMGAQTQLLRLLSDDAAIDEKLVLVKDLQRHPVTQDLIHADFYEVDVNEKIAVDISLRFVGKSAGVEVGGILQPIRRTIEVLCLPLQIPDEFAIDVTHLGIHDAVHISDVKAPEGVEIPFETDFAIVTVLPPVVEEAKAADVEEEGAEVVTEGVEGDKEEKKDEPAEG